MYVCVCDLHHQSVIPYSVTRMLCSDELPIILQVDQEEAFKIKSRKSIESHVRMLLSPFIDFSKVKTVDEVPMPLIEMTPETNFVDDQLLETSTDQDTSFDADDVKSDLDEHPELADHDDTDNW